MRELKIPQPPVELLKKWGWIPEDAELTEEQLAEAGRLWDKAVKAFVLEPGDLRKIIEEKVEDIERKAV